MEMKENISPTKEKTESVNAVPCAAKKKPVCEGYPGKTTEKELAWFIESHPDFP